MILDVFLRGGPVMWPLLLCSLISVTVTVERTLFWVMHSRARSEVTTEQAIRLIEEGNGGGAIGLLTSSDGSASHVFASGVRAWLGGENPTAAMEQAAVPLLRECKRGLRALDTIVTLAPMLGLLGTVTGVISSFGFLGKASDSGMAFNTSLVGGGIAEALITTAFGLCIAIVTVVPYNYFSSRVQRLAEDISSAGTAMEEAFRRKTS